MVDEARGLLRHPACASTATETGTVHIRDAVGCSASTKDHIQVMHPLSAGKGYGDVRPGFPPSGCRQHRSSAALGTECSVVGAAMPNRAPSTRTVASTRLVGR